MTDKKLKPIPIKGFSKDKLLKILISFKSDNWFGGKLKTLTNNDPIIMGAFHDEWDGLVSAISIAMGVNFERSRVLAVKFQDKQKEEYWSENGEGTRAKTIVMREKEANPFISTAKLAEILTEAQVLTFRGRMTSPENRTEADYHWTFVQVYNLMKKYMNISPTVPKSTVSPSPATTRKRGRPHKDKTVFAIS